MGNRCWDQLVRSVTKSFSNFVFDWKSEDPDFKIKIRIFQSNAPSVITVTVIKLGCTYEFTANLINGVVLCLLPGTV